MFATPRGKEACMVLLCPGPYRARAFPGALMRKQYSFWPTLAVLLGCLSAFGCAGGTTPPSCGNGVVDVGEQCDDGNTVSGDGCSST